MRPGIYVVPLWQRCDSSITSIRLGLFAGRSASLGRRRGWASPAAEPPLMRGVRCAVEPKKGKKVDPLKMLVADPSSIPMKGDPNYSAPGTAWRTDKYREMTYTQFWHLIQQKQIDKVRCPQMPDDCARMFICSWSAYMGGDCTSSR